MRAIGFERERERELIDPSRSTQFLVPCWDFWGPLGARGFGERIASLQIGRVDPQTNGR